MTLNDIRKSDAMRQSVETAISDPNVQAVLNAIRHEIVRRLGYTPKIQPGQSFESLLNCWHSHLSGMQEVIQLIESCSRPIAEPVHQEGERPFEHAIDPNLIPKDRQPHHIKP